MTTLLFGSGWVGGAVATRLEAAGATVHTVGRSSHPAIAERGEAGRAALLAEVERLGVTHVVNTAGRLTGTPEELDEANHRFPAWLAGVFTGTGVRFVHIGSAAEYGDPGSAVPIAETAECRPTGAYGTTKHAGSLAVLAARSEGLDAVVARGFNLVGPHTPPSSPLHQFIADVAALPAEGGEVEVWWPDTVRDFILLEDLAEGVARIALAADPPEVVNVCSGVGVRFADIVGALAERRGVPVRIRSLERPGIPAVVGDPGRLRALTGLVPAMSATLIAERAAIASSTGG